MEKDIQIFLGVQVKGIKYIVDKRFSIKEYKSAIDRKAYLDVALTYCNEDLKDLLKEKDLI